MKTLIAFPGQGSQFVGMMKEFSDEAVVLDVYQEASDVLGFDVWNLSIAGPEATLNETAFTQPALLTASVALWRLLTSKVSVSDVCLAGHSLGEYTALVAAGVLPFSEAVQLVQHRGTLMQQAVPAGMGAMAAILGLDDDLVALATQEASSAGIVSCANFNSLGQVVIAGERAAVELAMSICKEKGAKRCLPLPVSVPSHCALMKVASEKLDDYMRTLSWSNPTLSVIQNVDASIQTEVSAIQSRLVQQLSGAVQWRACVAKAVELGVNQHIEVGPGKVLTNLAKRMDGQLTPLSCGTKDALIEVVSVLEK